MTTRLRRGSDVWSRQWGKTEARRLDNRRRQIVATLETAGWSIVLDTAGRYWAFPPSRHLDGYGRRAAVPGTLTSERQARNLETALRSIGPYPREERGG